MKELLKENVLSLFGIKKNTDKIMRSALNECKTKIKKCSNVKAQIHKYF